MENDMRKMQQEAVQRVQEMQSRAKHHLKEESPKPPPKNEEKTVPSSPEIPPEKHATLFDGLMQDSERTLILMLALLLFTEQADPSVIFSLLYLIL